MIALQGPFDGNVSMLTALLDSIAPMQVSRPTLRRPTCQHPTLHFVGRSSPLDIKVVPVWRILCSSHLRRHPLSVRIAPVFNRVAHLKSSGLVLGSQREDGSAMCNAC